MHISTQQHFFLRGVSIIEGGGGVVSLMLLLSVFFGVCFWEEPIPLPFTSPLFMVSSKLRDPYPAGFGIFSRCFCFPWPSTAWSRRTRWSWWIRRGTSWSGGARDWRCRWRRTCSARGGRAHWFQNRCLRSPGWFFSIWESPRVWPCH